MGHLFSKKKSKVTEQDKAVLQLKVSRDKIKQYQKRSEAQLLKDRELAKKLIQAQKKERALLLLRKKRFVEAQLEKTDGQLENIERMIHDLEFAQIEIKVVDSLAAGNEALKEVNQLLNIEDIERILDETQEAKEKQEEISAMLCGFAAEAGISEEDLEGELAALLDAGGDVAKSLPDVPIEAVVDTLPEVAEDEPEAEKRKEGAKSERIAVVS